MITPAFSSNETPTSDVDGEEESPAIEEAPDVLEAPVLQLEDEGIIRPVVKVSSEEGRKMTPSPLAGE